MSSIIKRRVALFGLLVALGATERNAEAGAYWGLTGGPVTRGAAPRFSPALSEANTTVTSEYASGGLAAGLLLGFRFAGGKSPWTLETGGLFTTAPVNYSADNGFEVVRGETTATTAQIPFALRFSKWKFLSLGAGGYFDLALNGDFENDIGGFAFGRFEAPFASGKFRITGEARMNFGLPQAGWDSTLDSLILLGIIFGSSGGPSGR